MARDDGARPHSNSTAHAAELELPPTRPTHDPSGPGHATSEDRVPRRATPRTIGRRLGHFQIRDVLGSGGMGTVFEAHDDTLDRPVALKLLHPNLGHRSEQRLLREAQALARLSHPNVVRVYEAGVAGGRAYIAMERIVGQTLAHWQHTPRPWAACIAVYVQAGRGLAAAHARGLVHRDFKPSNCIIDEIDHVRVLDFGLARASTDHEAVAAEAQIFGVAGTLGYMALEQLRARPLDDKSDQFSFCVSLYEAVYGVRPFAGDDLEGLIQAIERGTIALPSAHRRAPSMLLRALIRGLAARPERRWPSMDHLLRELERIEGTRRLAAVPVRRGLIGIGLLGFAIFGLERWYEDPASARASPCRRGEPALVGVWDDEARADVRRVFAAQPALGEDIETRLDAHARRWQAQADRVCEAASAGAVEEHPGPPRTQCVQEDHDALRETVTLLRSGDPNVIAVAPKIVAALPDPSRCTRAHFVSLRPEPEDPVDAQDVRALRETLAHAAAAAGNVRHTQALVAIESALVEAAELGYPPLSAEARLLRGRVASEQDRVAEAVPDLEAAYAFAVQSHHHDVALAAATSLTYVVGDLLEQHEVGLNWGLTAEALARQPWVDRERALAVTEILGNVFYEQGRYAMARERLELALRTREDLTPESDQAVLTTANLGLVLIAQGRDEQALPLLYQALERRDADAGPEHPTIAVSLLSLACALSHLQRHAEAEPLVWRALDMRERSFGGRHPGVATALNVLGAVHLGQGDLAAALDAYQRALAIADDASPTHSHASASWLGLAKVLAAQGLYEAALRHARKAARVVQTALGPQHVRVGRTLAVLGRIERDAGELDAARVDLEQAVEVLATHEGPPLDLADARVDLADLWWSSASRREAARDLLRAARVSYVEVGFPGDARVPHIDERLAEP